MKKKFHLTICFLHIITLALFAQHDDGSEIILLSPEDGSFSINKSVYYFEDRDNSLSFEDILNPKFSERLTLIAREKLNFGYTNSTFWTKIQIKNTQPEVNDWLLEIEQQHMDSIDFYYTDRENHWEKKQYGDMYPFWQRDLDYRSFIIPLDLNDTITKTYYIRFRTSGTMQFPMNICREKNCFRKIILTEQYYGIFFGIMLLLIVFNLFSYISLRDVSYIYYILLIISSTVFLAFLSGHIFQYVLHDLMWWSNKSLPSSVILAEFCMICFTRSFLKVKKYSLRLNKILTIFLVSSGIIIFPLYFIKYKISGQIAAYTAQLYIILCLISGIICLIKGNKSARLFIIANSLFFIGAIAISFSAVGIIRENIFTVAHGMELGAMLNGIFLSLALVDNYRFDKIEKEKAQEEIIQMRVRVAEVLEQKVKERTSEIEEKNEELKKQQEELKNVNDILENQKEELQRTLENLELAQTQLVQSEKMASIGQLVAGIAHEINNPVNYISAGVDSLSTNLEEIRQVLESYHKINVDNVKEELKEIEDLKQKVDYKEALKEISKLINSIRNGTKRTSEIVRGLRTFSHLDEDTYKMTDIHEGIDSTLILHHNKYMNRIEMIKEYGDIPLIECYPGQMNQVFMNILSNAVDSIEDKGKITINTRIFGENVCISIKDNGKGIPENHIEKIFDPFFTTKEVGKGTGLGLSISRSIIEKHKGKIEVLSNPGQGTEFIITLPIVHPDK